MLIINSTGWSGRTDLIYKKPALYTSPIKSVTWRTRRRLPYLHGSLLWFVPYPEAERWEKI